MLLNKYAYHIAHIYVPLHFYCSLHVDLAFLHTSFKNQQTATFIYYSTAEYVPATNIPLKCHIPILLEVHLLGTYANLYAT